jgi:phage-related protein
MSKKTEKQKEYIVFNGSKFAIEWYFDHKGNSSALNYFESLSEDEQIKSLGLFELMGNIGEIKNKTKFNYEGDKIYAFKPQPYRFLCFFFAGGKIIITNAFHKKTDKLPIGEKNKALKYKDNYELRVNRGDYYE